MAHVGTQRAAQPLFGFLFYTGAWFPVEQRAIRNVTGWHRPESYLDEDAYDSGTGRKAGKLLHLLRADHPSLSVVVFTDDIQSEKLARVLPATQRAHGDAARIARVVRWMRGQELHMYRRADAVATVSQHDAAWVERRASAEDGDAAEAEGHEGQGDRQGDRDRQLVVADLPFVAHPPPPARVAPWSARTGLLYAGVAHTAAALSMRWFLHRVHPLLLAKLHARLGNITAALALSHLTIVGWGWKEHARRGAHCTTDSSVRGRGSRCAGAQRLIPTARDLLPAANTARVPPGGGGSVGAAVGVGGGEGGGGSGGGGGAVPMHLDAASMQEAAALLATGGGSGDGGRGGAAATAATAAEVAAAAAVAGDGTWESEGAAAAAAAGLPAGVAPLVTLMHAVDDEVLFQLFSSRRLFVAPCTSCTGVATKVVTALRHGIPVASTSEATRGIVDGYRPLVSGYRPLGGTPIDRAMRSGGGGGGGGGRGGSGAAGVRPPSEEVRTIAAANLLSEAVACAFRGGNPMSMSMSMSMYQRLQPYAPEVATLRTRGCNPMRQRLQPYVSQVLTVHDDPAAFAEAAARLLLDSAEWTAHSDASLRHTRSVLPAWLRVTAWQRLSPAAPAAFRPHRAVPHPVTAYMLYGYSLRHVWLQVLSEPALDVRLLALLSRLLARRCARGDEHAAAACAWRPKLLHAAWPGLRTFAQEVRWGWATPSYYIWLQPLLDMVAASVASGCR